MENTFTQVAVYEYPAEAHILKSKLESEGIKTFLFDEFTINTDPLISNAIGGVKVKVLTRQIEEARIVINSISKYDLDDEGAQIKCPKCNENKVRIYSTIKDIKSLFWFIIGFLSSTLPLYTKYKYKCENCKTEFSLK